MAALAIVVIIVLIVTAKTSHKASEIQSHGKRNLIPIIIILALLGAAFAGGH